MCVCVCVCVCRGGEGGGEREKEESDQSVASHPYMPQRGIKPATQVCALTDWGLNLQPAGVRDDTTQPGTLSALITRTLLPKETITEVHRLRYSNVLLNTTQNVSKI